VHGSADIEALARLAYKLCHMYYNWPGAVKVPAPVMMAHRLAYFVGQWVHEPVAPSIRSFSFYL
jgi:aubergine-like protein